MPGQPTLYKSKYPGGVKGVWDGKFSQIKNSPIFALPGKLLPNYKDGGSPPVWQVDLDFGQGIGNFGTHNLSPSPSIWRILRLIVIVSALIYAFRIIFSGG